MEKLDEIKAAYTELVYKTVVSADAVTAEVNEAIRLLTKLVENELQEENTRLELRNSELARELLASKQYWLFENGMLERRLESIAKDYTWEKPTTLWDKIKSLFVNEPVHHAGCGDDTKESEKVEKEEKTTTEDINGGAQSNLDATTDNTELESFRKRHFACLKDQIHRQINRK